MSDCIARGTATSPTRASRKIQPQVANQIGGLQHRNERGWLDAVDGTEAEEVTSRNRTNVLQLKRQE